MFIYIYIYIFFKRVVFMHSFSVRSRYLNEIQTKSSRGEIVDAICNKSKSLTSIVTKYITSMSHHKWLRAITDRSIRVRCSNGKPKARSESSTTISCVDHIMTSYG